VGVRRACVDGARPKRFVPGPRLDCHLAALALAAAHPGIRAPVAGLVRAPAPAAVGSLSGPPCIAHDVGEVPERLNGRDWKSRNGG
jgi:hypothetical protein